MSATDPWAPLGEGPAETPPTLNDELATEAQRVALRSHADLARRGTRHDPEL